MSKSDFPALRMIVEGGRLVPAGQFDAERLASYRRGAVVMCRFTEEKDRVLVRKWWAILGLVVKQCETPWKTKEEASEAVKLALGVVNLSKTVNDNWMQYPKSLTELQDPEMLEALEAMTELLSRMTGVDVETLRKETDHIREYDNTNSGSPPPEADDAPSSSSAEPEVPSPASGSPIIECAKEMLSLAVLSYESDKDRDEALSQCMEQWEAKLPNHRALTDDIAVAATAVATGRRTMEQALPFLAGKIGCAAADIGGEANG